MPGRGFDRLGRPARPVRAAASRPRYRNSDVPDGGSTGAERLAAESLGTIWLVLGDCGSAVLAAAFPQVGIGLLGVSLAFGPTVLTMAYDVGEPVIGGESPATA